MYVHHYSTMYSDLFYFLDNSEVISAALGFDTEVCVWVCVPCSTLTTFFIHSNTAFQLGDRK